jgi:hypothetical protein
MSQTSEAVETPMPVVGTRTSHRVTTASDVLAALQARQRSRKPRLEKREAQAVHTKPIGLPSDRGVKPVSIPAWARPINPPIQTTD